MSKQLLILSIIAISLVSIQCEEEDVQMQYKYFVFSEKCYHQIILQGDYMNLQCIKQIFSKLMGYGIVLGGGIVKIPQIIKIVMDQSVFGLSYFSIILESATNWITIVYSLHAFIPFSIYGENAFILTQNIIILFFFIIYGNKLPSKDKQANTSTAFYGLFFIIIMAIMYITQDTSIWPQILINNVMYFQMMLFSSARFAQILYIWRYKSTGSLSLITCALNVLGNIGRLFTIFVQVNDRLFAASVILAFILNATILIQFIIYWNNKAPQAPKPNKAHKQL